ncbi:MAG: carboxylesterase family protein, partial [Thermoanaerobaculia bacterium]|nr:carboxylesterase family protein [Thermoanaerobaculia bacterium]
YDLQRPAGISWFTPFWPAGQSEDCLALNVWTPGLDGAKRPVLVWFHGGGYSRGSGGSSAYEGTNIALRGDVVSVTVNHRLNVFGYAALGELLGADFEHAGNAGMLDLVHSLHWVRDNIERFGGDPDNVLIHGESGGGAKVSTLLAMPGAEGLFHRAVIQSGPALRVETPANATKTAQYLLDELGLGPRDVDALRAVPTDKLLAAGVAAAARAAREGAGRGFRPVLGSDIPAHPFDPIGPEMSADVPVMIGSNLHETTLFVTQDRELFELDGRGLAERTRRIYGDDTEEVLATYREAYPGATPSDLYFVLASDGTRFRSIQLAEAKLERAATMAGAAPVYMYRFDWLTPAWEGRFRAAHAFEIPFVFGNAQLNDEITGGGPDAVALAARMRDAWVAFARHGAPGHDELPRWPAYDTKTRATMLFNDTCTVANDPGKAERLLWNRLRAS